jgi:UDP-glucose 4-epimerase
MKVLVTGGAGYVGSVCVEELVAAGHEVVVIDDFRFGHRGAVHPAAQLVEADFGDTAAVRRVFQKTHIDAVMHFAGETLVTKSMTDPQTYFKANVVSGIDFLGAVRENGVKAFIFSSTAAVYGEPIATPITENHSTKPINAYGESKLMFERVLEWYRRAYSLNYVALRYFNAAGASSAYGEAHSPESHLLPLLLDSVIPPTQKFVIHGQDYDTPDGTCVRDYVHVVDIAQAHLLAMDAVMLGSHHGAYNIGSSHGHSVLQVMRTVEEVTGRELPFRIGPRRQGDPAVLVASHQKLATELGWRPRFSDLQNIVRSAWIWKQRHPTAYDSGDPGVNHESIDDLHSSGVK